MLDNRNFALTENGIHLISVQDRKRRRSAADNHPAIRSKTFGLDNVHTGFTRHTTTEDAGFVPVSEHAGSASDLY
jgi:hypothetical protein